MNQISYFEIQAEDCGKAVEFYKTIFNWKFTRDPNIPIEYWRIETEGIRGAILARPAPVPKGPAGTNAYVCSMEVKSFDETAKKILELGGIEALPKFAIPGVCWQGYFLDNAGNTFGIFEPDPNAK